MSWCFRFSHLWLCSGPQGRTTLNSKFPFKTASTCWVAKRCFFTSAYYTTRGVLPKAETIFETSEGFRLVLVTCQMSCLSLSMVICFSCLLRKAKCLEVFLTQFAFSKTLFSQQVTRSFPAFENFQSSCFFPTVCAFLYWLFLTRLHRRNSSSFPELNLRAKKKKI